jgi:hypothetical protein
MKKQDLLITDVELSVTYFQINNGHISAVFLQNEKKTLDFSNVQNDKIFR